MAMRGLVDFWQSLRRQNSFIQNFAFVFSGKSINVLIGFAIVPILARIYSPEAYGLYGLYFVFVANISVLMSLRLPAAFVVIGDEKKFKILIKSFSSILLVFTVITVLVLYLWGDAIFFFFNASKLDGKKGLIVLGAWTTALATGLGSWNVREKSFKKSTVISVSESTMTRATNLVIGLWGGITTGLIWGDILGRMLAIGLQFRIFIKNKWSYLVPEYRFKTLASTFWQYRDYPFYILPSAWIVIFTNNLIILFIGNQYSLDMVGRFTMASSIVFLPVNLIANASQPLLMQKAADSKEDPERLKQNVSRLVNTILYFGSAAVLVTIIFIEPVINIFLGRDWEGTGEFIRILSPMLVFQTLFIITSGILLGLGLTKNMLFIQLSRAIFIVTIIGFMYFLQESFFEELLIYSGLSTLMLTVLCVIILWRSDLLELKSYISAFLTYVLSVFIGFAIFLIWMK